MIVPSSSEADVVALAMRLSERLHGVELDLAGRIAGPVGIAQDRSTPRIRAS